VEERRGIGAPGREAAACVAGDEEGRSLWQSTRGQSLAGWAAPRSWLRGENVRNKPHGGRGDQCARAGHAEHRGVCARVC
jgi:uncharacterized membrane-anchored protein